jgi:hypothetical protein
MKKTWNKLEGHAEVVKDKPQKESERSHYKDTDKNQLRISGGR